jgi:hypothetical protein
MAQGETGDRMVGWGIHFRVSGDGDGNREFRCRPFGHQGAQTGSDTFSIPNEVRPHFAGSRVPAAEG